MCPQSLGLPETLAIIRTMMLNIFPDYLFDTFPLQLEQVHSDPDPAFHIAFLVKSQLGSIDSDADSGSVGWKPLVGSVEYCVLIDCWMGYDIST